MRPARPLGAVAALVLAAGCLAACQTHVGAAAFIGSERISESDVNSYLTPQAKSFTQTDPNTGQSTLSNPKTDVVDLIVADRLVLDVLKKQPGGLPPAGEVAQARAAYIQQIGQTEAQLAVTDRAQGFATPYTTLLLDFRANLAVAASELKDPGDLSVVVGAIQKLNVTIRVNPRYGVWVPAQLEVTNGPAQPSFLTLSSTPSATDTAAAGGSG